MKRIVSKQVLALYPGGQLLQDQYFNEIREKVFGKDPKYNLTEDTAPHQDKKNVIRSPTTFGPNDRLHNPGAGMGLDREDTQSKARGVGSGYNDGEHPDDETGPGNTSVTPDPYYTSDVFNELFLKLRMNQRNDSIQSHLKSLMNRTPVRTRAY